PPEVDVVREPRSGVTLTHRTVVVLDPEGGTAGWKRTAPRAVLAPATERWAEDVLGAAADWQIPVGGHQVGLDDLHVSALDELVTAITAVADAAGGLDPDTLADAVLDGDLMTAFRELGLPGSMHGGAQVSARDAIGVASAGATVLRDIDQLIARGLPQPP